MVKRASLAALAGLVLLTACAITRKGTLTKLPSGPNIAVTVSVSETEATLKGTDSQTGEEFEGTFQVVETKGGGGMLGPSPPVGAGPLTPGQPPVPKTGAKATIQMSGRVEGSKGTSLRCAIQVERTLTMKGSGTCLLADSMDLNPAYHLRF